MSAIAAPGRGFQDAASLHQGVFGSHACMDNKVYLEQHSTRRDPDSLTPNAGKLFWTSIGAQPQALAVCLMITH